MRAFIAFMLSALAVSGAESVSVGIRTNYVPVHGDIIWRSNGVWMLLGRGSDGYFLKVDGSNLVWAASTPGGGSGTVTSVGATSDVSGLSFSGSPVTISGNLGLTGILGLASGGTAGTNAATARTSLGIGTAGTNDASAFAAAAHDHSGVYQPADSDLDDLADGSLTGSKVGSGIDDDNVSFDDADNLWTATAVGPALEELNDSINAGVPNGAGAKVHWSQLLDVPAGFADGTDDGAGGGSGTVTGITLTNAPAVPLYFTPNSTTTSNTFTLTSSNQTANTVFAGPSSGAAAAPTFRSLVDDDIPNTITVDLATTATTATTANAGDSATSFFSSGQIERARGGTGADTSAYGAGLLGSDGSNNTIDVDTEAELETALGSIDVVTVTTDDITSANLRTMLSDETGIGAAVFVGGDIGAATATTPTAGDADTSVATTAFVASRIETDGYDATSWNGNTNAPTKDAIRDKLESLGGGSGDVVGPASSTTNAVALFDGTTGKLLKNSSVTIDGDGGVVLPSGVTFGGRYMTNWPIVSDGYYDVLSTECLVSSSYSTALWGTPFAGSALASGTQAVGGDSGGVYINGYFRLSASSSANSGWNYHLNNSGILLTNGSLALIEVRPQATNSTVVQERIGWQDSGAASLPVDGLYWNRDGNAVTLVARSNSTTTASVDSYLIESNTWYRAAIAINKVGSDDVSSMWIYGYDWTLLSTLKITNGLPLDAGRETGFVCTARSTNGVSGLVLTDISKMWFAMPKR